jgi:Rod binding domain-containing protein
MINSSTMAKNVAKEFAEQTVMHLVKEFFPEENNTLFNGGNTEKVFRDFLVDAYSKELATQQDFGIEHQIIKHLDKQQEHTQNNYDILRGKNAYAANKFLL